MNELERISQELVGPATPQTIDRLQTEATKQIYESTYAAYKEKVLQAVADAQSLQDPQHQRYLVPFLEEATRVYGRHLLNQQERSMEYVEEVVHQYRTRRYHSS